MPTFPAPDGTELAYHRSGEGDPVICLPGGPMVESGYFGDLGGLGMRRELILLDLRGTGDSAVPADASSYRCDRMVDDVEALRNHLGLTRIDLLGHSAGANLATQYAARHPNRVSKLALICPSAMAVGVDVTVEMRREIADLRKGEPWFEAAFAALESIMAGTGGDWDAIAPFFYGRWDAGAQRHQKASQPTNIEAARFFGSEGAFDPASTRDALGACQAPTLLLAGELDLNSPPRSVAEFAGLFPDARFVVQPGAGHTPWLDEADRFVATTAGFLG